MEKIVIAGFAGIGKTTLDKLNPENVLDMEIRPYKYENYKNEYTLKQWYGMEHILKENFLPKYIEALKEKIANGTHKVIFVWLTIEVLELLSKEKIDYVVATWNHEEEGIKDYLRSLYIKRGNPDYWIEKVLNYLDVINKYVIDNKIETIFLNKNENIEMRLKKRNII